MEAKQEHSVRWGIIGTGKIAADFATALNQIGAKITAVSSRNEKGAEEFAKKFNITAHYGDFNKVANDPNVDFVYVSSIHPAHKEHAIACLKAKKATIVEKPITLNAKDTNELIELARANKVLLMEAMWTRYFPAMTKVRSLIAEGCIGNPQTLFADFGFVNAGKERLSVPELGGGAMLDIGIYVVAFSSMIFGKPEKVSASGFIGSTKVDEHVSVTLTHPNEKISNLFVTFRGFTPREAKIVGDKGTIIVHFPFWCTNKVSLVLNDGKTEDFEFPLPQIKEGDSYNYRNSVGLTYEAAYAQKLFLDKKTESDLHPLDEILHIMQTIDEVRKQIGMKYPSEQ